MTPTAHSHRCIHCKAIEAIIAEVATQLSDDASFQVYRIDGAKNEVAHRGVKVFAFPTIYFFPAYRYRSDPEATDSSEGEYSLGDEKLPVLYDGDRSVESLLEFIATHRHTAAAADNSDRTTAAAEEEALPLQTEGEGELQELNVVLAHEESCEADAVETTDEVLEIEEMIDPQ